MTNPEPVQMPSGGWLAQRQWHGITEMRILPSYDEAKAWQSG